MALPPRFTQWLLVGIPLLGVTALGIGALASAKPPQAPSATLHWAMASSSLGNISAADEAQASRSFDTANTAIQNTSPLTTSPVPSGWASARTELWRSYAQFAADVRAGAVPPYVEVVHYDNEAWADTPKAEQLNPAHYEREFCALAHSRGWLCYLGPARDLCNVLPGPVGDDNSHCYIDLNLAGQAARYADIIDIQAQALEPLGPRIYSAFLRKAASLARAANPGVLIMGNISPSPGGIPVSARKMYACATAALPYVRGFYVTVSSNQGDTMVSFLRLLDS